MTFADPIVEQITAALEPHGLVPRGGFVFSAGDGAPDLNHGVPAQSVVLVGHFGSSIWPHFAAWRREHPDSADPLDAWSKEVLTHIAGDVGGQAVFPSDRPYLPFQQWAKRVEGLSASPLGMLIHPEFGLWQAFRGAILFSRPIVFSSIASIDHPCDSCVEKPCLHACPVDAFDGNSFAVDRCRSYLATPEGQPCLDDGCLARLACPVGREHAYVQDQQRFHMAAFAHA
ncbi:4Fe-4S dicluster domain-containing protein [Phyllobacterium sp. 628]|uniref:4Fe-4S dicluster domain-containing protein n=1 Tax=Phyllobacterium sp. 628 TaxID=2718938 RepID=UPI00166273C2|nr:4Fe-4S dicluster domain-containing protein [Phyllobacterium sp. 628]QND53549.1 4Fe-4S dicluster domain-containing protein [Phyllobacterium sp. 628]